MIAGLPDDQVSPATSSTDEDDLAPPSPASVKAPMAPQTPAVTPADPNVPPPPPVTSFASLDEDLPPAPMEVLSETPDKPVEPAVMPETGPADQVIPPAAQPQPAPTPSISRSPVTDDKKIEEPKVKAEPVIAPPTKAEVPPEEAFPTAGQPVPEGQQKELEEKAKDLIVNSGGKVSKKPPSKMLKTVLGVLALMLVGTGTFFGYQLVTTGGIGDIRQEAAKNCEDYGSPAKRKACWEAEGDSRAGPGIEAANIEKANELGLGLDENNNIVWQDFREKNPDGELRTGTNAAGSGVYYSTSETLPWRTQGYEPWEINNLNTTPGDNRAGAWCKGPCEQEPDSEYAGYYTHNNKYYPIDTTPEFTYEEKDGGGEPPPPTQPPGETLACTALTSVPAVPKLGDSPSFTCTGTSSPGPIDHYVFEYKVGSGDYTALAESSLGSGQSITLTITDPGTYTVRCRACSSADDTNCTAWQTL